jgi:hypothetical protein
MPELLVLNDVIACYHDSVIGGSDDRVIEEFEHAVLNDRASHRVGSDVDAVYVTLRRQSPEPTVWHHQRICRRPEVHDGLVVPIVYTADGGSIDIIHLPLTLEKRASLY